MHGLPSGARVVLLFAERGDEVRSNRVTFGHHQLCVVLDSVTYFLCVNAALAFLALSGVGAPCALIHAPFGIVSSGSSAYFGWLSGNKGRTQNDPYEPFVVSF